MSIRKESKFIRYMKKARDFYVRSLTSCAGNTAYGGGAAVGVPSLQLPGQLPRSFSANSDYNSREEDLRELIRIASTRSLAGKVEAELRRSSPVRASGVAVVSRSQTVSVERIDEDKPYGIGVGPKAKLG